MRAGFAFHCPVPHNNSKNKDKRDNISVSENINVMSDFFKAIMYY